MLWEENLREVIPLVLIGTHGLAVLGIDDHGIPPV